MPNESSALFSPIRRGDRSSSHFAKINLTEALLPAYEFHQQLSAHHSSHRDTVHRPISKISIHKISPIMQYTPFARDEFSNISGTAFQVMTISSHVIPVSSHRSHIKHTPSARPLWRGNQLAFFHTFPSTNLDTFESFNTASPFHCEQVNQCNIEQQQNDKQ